MSIGPALTKRDNLTYNIDDLDRAYFDSFCLLSKNCDYLSLNVIAKKAKVFPSPFLTRSSFNSY